MQWEKRSGEASELDLVRRGICAEVDILQEDVAQLWYSSLAMFNKREAWKRTSHSVGCALPLDTILEMQLPLV